MSESARRNSQIIDLLKNSKKRDYDRAQLLADEVLDQSTAVILDLVLKLIDAEAIDTTIGLDLVSFVDEKDLSTVAKRCLSACSEDRTACLEQIALQQPDAVPSSIRDEMFDFRNWRDDPVPRRPPMHLIFEHGARSQVFAPRWGTRDRHPTWALPAQSQNYRFGGPGTTRCPSCGQFQIHLLTIDHEIPGFTLAKDKLVIESCPTCWSEAYYRHNTDGLPSRIEPVVVEGYRWENVPLEEQRIKLATTPRRWSLQSWGHSNSRQNISRLGGHTSWIQYSQIPVVPGTDRRMELLLQLDSFYPTKDGGEMLWGSGGMLYVFWDAATRTSCILGQWT